jgi:hypothetical protein
LTAVHSVLAVYSSVFLFLKGQILTFGEWKGEKYADTLLSLGIPNTTNMGK